MTNRASHKWARCGWTACCVLCNDVDNAVDVDVDVLTVAPANKLQTPAGQEIDVD